MNMPERLKYWTADQVAECVPFESILGKEAGDALYCKLWQILSEAKNPTPLGGDGSNGTVETPGERLDEDNDDKAPHWWGKLNNAEQRAVADGYAAEFGGNS